MNDRNFLLHRIVRFLDGIAAPMHGFWWMITKIIMVAIILISTIIGLINSGSLIGLFTGFVVGIVLALFFWIGMWIPLRDIADGPRIRRTRLRAMEQDGPDKKQLRFAFFALVIAFICSLISLAWLLHTSDSRGVQLFFLSTLLAGVIDRVFLKLRVVGKYAIYLATMLLLATGYMLARIFGLV